MTTKVSVRVQELISLKVIATLAYQQVVVIFYYKRVNFSIKFSCNGKWKTVSNHLNRRTRVRLSRFSHTSQEAREKLPAMFQLLLCCFLTAGQGSVFMLLVGLYFRLVYTNGS